MEANSEKGNRYQPTSGTSTYSLAHKSSISTFESGDANSTIYGGSAFGSSIGHDDPTAVIENLRRTESIPGFPSFGTTDSLLTDQSEPSRQFEFRHQRSDGYRKPSTFNNLTIFEEERELSQQLNELDRTEEQWQAKMSQKTSSVGEKESNTKLSSDAITANKEILAIVEDLAVEQALSQALSQVENGTKSNKAGDDSSTDQSLTSSASETGILRKHEGGSGTPTGDSSETDEIVRQVQRRLYGVSLKEGENEKGEAAGRAAMSDNSSVETEEPKPGCGLCVGWKRLVIYGLMLLILAGVGIAMIILKMLRPGHASSRNPNPEKRPVPSIPTTSSPSFSPLPLPAPSGASPTISPTVFSSTSPNASPSANPGSPTDSAPTGRPIPLPSGHPLVSPTDQPVASPTIGAPNTPTIKPTALRTTSPTAFPTKPPTRFPTSSPTVKMSPREAASEILFPISGEALYDSSTAQFETFEWLIDEKDSEITISRADTIKERYAVALLHFAVGGQGWTRQFGFLGSSSVCDWNEENIGMGVFCDAKGSVQELAINENNVYGSLPAELVALTMLKVLEMRGNQITGTIPSVIGDLSLLEQLDLRDNDLSGSIPESIFHLQNLKRLFLFLNINLGGTIPPSIGEASSLEMISFQRCRLSGSLPDELSELSKLSFLALMDNELTGSIPEGLTLLPKLEVLGLARNDLSGSIPTFAAQKGLYYITMSENRLNGTIPESIGSLPGLLFIDVRENRLQGTIPNSIGTIRDLVTIFASDNELTGSIPSFDGNRGLQAVNFANNQLTGHVEHFFSERGPTRKLSSVDFGMNSLKGTIPTTVGVFKSLVEVVLTENQFSGPIPEEITSLTNMDMLSLGANHLNGTIPQSIGSLSHLTQLDLGNNELGGSIPSDLNILTRLDTLILGPNKLQGKVPSTLGELDRLDKLSLHQNSLTGDLNHIFCIEGSNSRPIETFTADCAASTPEIICSCCTSCCDDLSEKCEPNI